MKEVGFETGRERERKERKAEKGARIKYK